MNKKTFFLNLIAIMTVIIVLLTGTLLTADERDNPSPFKQYEPREQKEPPDNPENHKADEPPDYWVKQLRHVFTLAEKNLFDARFILNMKDKINLTEDQVRKVETIMMAHQESCIRIGAEIKIRELRLASYIKSDKIDKKQMGTYIQEISKQKTDWVVRYFNYLLDLREILTTKQLKILATIKTRAWDK